MRLVLLDKTEAVIGALTSLKEGTETYEINVASQLNVTVPGDIKSRNLLADTHYIAVPTVDDPVNQFHMYTLQNIKTSNTDLILEGIETAFDELDGGYLGELRLVNKTLSESAHIVFDGTRWTIGTIAQVTSTMYVTYISRLEALKKLVAAYGVEVQFIYTIKDNRITKRTVNLVGQLGKQTYERFVYGSNALTVESEEARGGIYTAAVGRGKGEEKTDADGNSTGGYGRKIRFDTIAWSTASGNPVDKPAGQEYVEIPEATAKWGYPQPNGSMAPRITVLDFDDDTDPAVLIQHTYEALLDLTRPKVQFSSTLARLGFLAVLGDAVIIIRRDLGIVYSARIFKMIRNLLDPDATDVSVGDYLLKSVAEREDDMQSQINSTQSAVDDTNQALDDTASDLSDQISAGDDALSQQINEQGVEQTKTYQELKDEADKRFADADAKAESILKDLGNYKGTVTEELKKYNDGWTQKYTDQDMNIAQLTQSIEGFQVEYTNDQKTYDSRFTVMQGLIDAKVDDAGLTARITTQVNKGLASIDLKADGGYLSITGGTGVSSQIFLGADNLYLTGKTHVDGEFFVNGVNAIGQVQILPTGLHIFDDYANEDIGYIHSNNWTGHDEINGLSFDLNPLGDYMAWGHRDSTSSQFITALTYFARQSEANVVGLNQGFTFGDPVRFNSNLDMRNVVIQSNGTQISTGADNNLMWFTISFAGGNYATLGNKSMNSGIMFGANTLYLLSGGTVYKPESFLN